MVVALRVDLGSGPAKDPEGVVGSEGDEGEGDGARPGLPVRVGFGEEEVADEVVLGRGWWGVDGEEVEVGGGVDSGPFDVDGVAGFGEGGRVDGNGGFGLDEMRV